MDVFERNASGNTFTKKSLEELTLKRKEYPVGFSTVLASDGNFFYYDLDGQALLRWFKDPSGNWTSEIIETSDKENYKHPAMAPDENYLLTTTDDNDINIWEPDATGNWQLSILPLHSPQTMEAFFVSPNSKYFLTVNQTSQTDEFWSKNNQGKWECQEFDGVDGGVSISMEYLKYLKRLLLITASPLS